ncbi:MULTISPECIES: PQQ-dependent sugar dehydrogenase [Phenylobacterium]|uniref:Glucose/arabinose dehydrogenase n=1 Tax=Phenylobacterium koreense TaxID=266125 RepID=A0ABV2EDV0_9CAUL
MTPRLLPLLAATSLAACAQGSPDPFAGFGHQPTLPAPQTSIIPTLNARQAVGWPAGVQPQAPAGFTVTRFAGDLAHPRWLLVLPNGDVLVSEASSEAKPAKTIADWFANRQEAKAGAAMPSPNRIMLLRDADGDGMAETRTVFAQGLKRPFGMALTGGQLYVANDDGVVAFDYADGQTSVTGPGRRVFDLPGDPINHHWTKTVVADPTGARLYATVGSNSNVGENGMEAEAGRAAVVQFPLPNGPARIYASGLRNPVGLAFEPRTGVLWTAVNERDMLGDDLVPDYMTGLREGAFYGWPYSYFGQNVDERVKPPRPDLVATAIAPDYALGAHTASLGLAFYTAELFPAHYRGGAFVGQHGSWNRRPPAGYRVVFVPFENGRPTGPPEVFLTGFLNARDEAQGRPVGVAVDKAGALLVADDVGKAIWRVTPSSGATGASPSTGTSR